MKNVQMYKLNSFQLIRVVLPLALAIFISPLSSFLIMLTNDKPNEAYLNGPIFTGGVDLSILLFGKINEQQKSWPRFSIQSLDNVKYVLLEL